MAICDMLIDAWDEAIWEYSLAFEGLADEAVWRRPHPRILSIGELTGHVAYYEAIMFGDQSVETVANPVKTPIVSSIAIPVFKYYETQVEFPVVFDLSASELVGELKRIHHSAKEAVIHLDPHYTDPVLGREHWTWGAYLKYRAFHAAYHAGQAYSVRHHFGDTTTDN